MLPLCFLGIKNFCCPHKLAPQPHSITYWIYIATESDQKCIFNEQVQEQKQYAMLLTINKTELSFKSIRHTGDKFVFII